MTNRLTAIGAALGLVGAWLVTAASSAPACATSNIFVELTGFAPPAADFAPFYYAVEDGGSTTFVVVRRGHDCEFGTASAEYDVVDGSAVAGSDFVDTFGTASGLRDSHDLPPHDQPVDVPVLDDGDIEPIERATVVLSNPREQFNRVAHLGTPASGALYIIDNDAPEETASFGDESHAQSERQATVRIPVFRSGASTAGSLTVSYSLVPGQTNPASPGGDYIGDENGQLTFNSGVRVSAISFSLVGDAKVEEDETVQLTLSGPGVVAPDSMTVTIENDDVAESDPPSSRLHHPKHNRRYPPNQFAGRGIHILTQDGQGGSGVVKAQFALRRTKKGGKCSWWSGAGFKGGPCSDKKWIKGRVLQEGAFYFYTIKRLAPSIGTKITSYKMWSRAFDGAGNVESSFQRNRNANTFEITRR